MSIENCKLIELPVIDDPHGKLTFVEQMRHVPFEIARVYHSYDIPEGATRGGHAHWACEEILLAMSGSFVIAVDDGSRRDSFRLDRSHAGLYLPPLVWREVVDISPRSICMAVASNGYDEADYIRDYGEFKKAVAGLITAPEAV